MGTIWTKNDRSLRVIQQQQRAWCARNFPGRTAGLPLMGVSEEIGELVREERRRLRSPRTWRRFQDWLTHITVLVGLLCHSLLKRCCGIRDFGDLVAVARSQDAIGDIVLFLMDYCSAEGWELQDILDTVWDKVCQWDWVHYPLTGVPSGDASKIAEVA